MDDEFGTATGRSSYVVLQGAPGQPLQPIIAGRYHDTFRAGPAGWSFAERRFLVDLAGDLAHHLRFDLPDPAAEG